MKNLLVYRSLCCWSVYLMSVGFPGLAFSEELLTQEEQKKTTIEDVSLCSKEILMTFFPQPLVKKILVQNDISEEQSDQIAKELSKKDQSIVKLVEAKASQLDPNPFKDLKQRETAIKIFRETLYEVFSNTLKAYGIEDEGKSHQLLDKIQEAKGRLFVECIRHEEMKKDKEKD